MPAFVAYRKVRVPVGSRKRLSLTRRKGGVLKFADETWGIDYHADIVGVQVETTDGTVLWFTPWFGGAVKKVKPKDTFHLVDVKVSIA
jgi:hypothetical protein